MPSGPYIAGIAAIICGPNGPIGENPGGMPGIAGYPGGYPGTGLALVVDSSFFSSFLSSLELLLLLLPLSRFPRSLEIQLFTCENRPRWPLLLLLLEFPLSSASARFACNSSATSSRAIAKRRSEEHTSELQSRGHLVCRLLLEKKN